MKISISTANCDYENAFLIECSADSEIEIKLEFEKIVSVQSRNERQQELCNIIQKELSNFKWIIVGNVNIEFIWYLNGTERQETDRVGDIDNITKPMLDSLTGANGILIDDCQIKSFYTFWSSRNEQIADNVLYIKIRFINESVILKKDLIFIQYTGAVCTPINVDFNKRKDILAAFFIIKAYQKRRKSAADIKSLGCNVDRALVVSDWDIHRTRLTGFERINIYSLNQFKAKCYEHGFTWEILRALRKHPKIN